MTDSWNEYAIRWTYPEDIAGSYTDYGRNYEQAWGMLRLSMFHKGYLVTRVVTRSDWEPFNVPY